MHHSIRGVSLDAIVNARLGGDALVRLTGEFGGSRFTATAASMSTLKWVSLSVDLGVCIAKEHRICTGRLIPLNKHTYVQA